MPMEAFLPRIRDPLLVLLYALQRTSTQIDELARPKPRHGLLVSLSKTALNKNAKEIEANKTGR